MEKFYSFYPCLSLPPLLSCSLFIGCVAPGNFCLIKNNLVEFSTEYMQYAKRWLWQTFLLSFVIWKQRQGSKVASSFKYHNSPFVENIINFHIISTAMHTSLSICFKVHLLTSFQFQNQTYKSIIAAVTGQSPCANLHINPILKTLFY